MLLEYAIDACLSSPKEVEGFGEDYARETSASFGRKPPPIDAGACFGRDQRPTRY